MMQYTGEPAIELIIDYLELLSEEQHQEVINFVQYLLIDAILEKTRSLPSNRQCQVLDFVDYLAEKSKK